MVKINSTMRKLIQNMVNNERAREDNPNLTDEKAFKNAYEYWYRSVS